MTNLLPHNELHYYIEHAWREIQHDPHHRMRIHTRLHIYDLLVQDLGVPMYELAVTNKLSFFPKLTQGLYRYVYLGFQTVTPLIPIWEHEIKRQLTVNPDFEPDWSFPSIILDASYELLAGKTEDEVETFLEQKQTYWTDIRHWDQMVGNITEFIPYTPRMCLNAVYKVHSAVYGLPPIKCAFSSQAYDDDIDVCSNDDFTYYAFEAMTSVVATTTDEQQLSTQPTKRDPQKALDFWHWWLFELVPGAATVDLNALGWYMTYGRYTNVTR